MNVYFENIKKYYCLITGGGPEFTFIDDEDAGTSMVEYYIGRKNTAEVPNVHGSYPVTSIGPSAFIGDDMTSVTIQKGITEIL